MASPTLGWLLLHELRMGLRVGSGGSSWRRFAGLLLVAALPVGLGWLLAVRLADVPDWPSPAAVAMLSAGHAMMLPLMLSFASVQVLRSFRERGDLDLLLSAPLPQERVFRAKALASSWLVAMPFMAMLGPFVVFSMVLGHLNWGGALLVILATAGIATGLGYLVVAMLIGWLGQRRARIAVHLGSAALGASIFIGTQIGGFGSGGGRVAMVQQLAAADLPAPLDWGGQAMLGAPLPILVLLLLAALSLLLAEGPGARRLAEQSHEQGTDTLTPRTITFSDRPLVALATKELRLLWRDPETLAQVLLRFIYLVPLVWLASDPATAPQTAARQLLGGGTALAAMAASSLTWITVCSEEAPELVEAAPIPAWQRQGAKLLVACSLPLLALLPLGVWLATLSVPAALLLLPLAALASLSMAAMQAWHGPRMPRLAFRKRPSALLLMGLIEIGVAGAWAAAAALLVGGSIWAMVPLLLVATVVGLGWMLRKRR